MEAVSPRISFKSIALPAEHGGWGFLLEPIVLGLLIAPSLAGFWLVVAAVGVFLLHQPLKVALKDRLKGRRYERTRWAERFAAGYGLLALVGFLLALLNAGMVFLPPLIIAVPLALVQIAYETRNEGRALLPEVSGALALGAVAPAIALTGGWELPAALVLWLTLGLRAVTSIVYVRARLRLEHGKPAPVRDAIAAHGVALAVMLGLAIAGAVTWAPVIAVAILLVRASVGLSSLRKPRKPREIGFAEMAYGLMMVIALAI